MMGSDILVFIEWLRNLWQITEKRELRKTVMRWMAGETARDILKLGNALMV